VLVDEEEVYVEVKARLSSFIGQVMDDDGLLTVCARVRPKAMSMPRKPGVGRCPGQFGIPSPVCASGPYRREPQIQYQDWQCQRRYQRRSIPRLGRKSLWTCDV